MVLFIVDSPLHSIKGNYRFFDVARMGIASQSIDVPPGDIVSQAGDNRKNKPIRLVICVLSGLRLYTMQSI